MIPSTFTLTSARTVTYDDGVRALILDGDHFTGQVAMPLGKPHDRTTGCELVPQCEPYAEPVSVTVFLGRGDDMAAAITRALTEGEGE